MNKITIGIPKSLLYYKYKDLWINFFKYLDCNIVISPNTNKEILENGIKLSMDESCLAMKIYLGHINYLKDKCDYIFVPRIECIKKNEKTCTNFSALYDLINTIFETKILYYNVNLEKNIDEYTAFINMGKYLKIPLNKIKKAYFEAKNKEKILKINNILKQNKILQDSNKIKILLAGHPYNLYDDFIGNQIVKVLKDNNVTIIFSDIYDDINLENEVKAISKNNYWTYNKEMIGAIEHYKNKIDGIILVTSFPCGPDSLSNEMIIRNVSIPITNIIMDEGNSNTGLITRIESFIDILEERKKNERKNN